MQQRSLGPDGPTVGAIGFGAMVLSPGIYGDVDDDQAAATLRRAVELGVTLFDTANVYGAGHNETLLGRALGPVRDDVILSTKVGLTLDAQGVPAGVDGRPESLRAAARASLRRLGTDRIDLLYLHRPDPAVPIEESIGALAALVAEGCVRFLGVSGVTVEQLHAADAVRPIAAVQNEYSLWTRDPEQDGVAEACEQIGAALVCYSPLGAGFLAGAVTGADDLDAGDFRRMLPRFQRENLRRNQDRFAPLRAIAADRGVHPAQLALAWLLARGRTTIPIPGTRDQRHLETNVAAAEIELTQHELAAIGQAAPAGLAAGTRPF